MEANFVRLLPYKSEAELQHYLNNRASFPPEAVMAVFEEMKKRGHVFTADEIDTIKGDVNTQGEALEDAGSKNVLGWGWRRNIVDDEAAPKLFSQMAINGFSIFFSTLFGAILFAINMYRVGKKDKIYIIILLAVAYTILEGWLVTMQPQSTMLPLFFNLIGGLLLNTVAWNKFIGKSTQYRRTSIWVPLAIGIGLTAIFVMAIAHGLIAPM